MIVQEKTAAQAKAQSCDLQITSGPVSWWVNDIRSLFRPALTVFLWVVVGVLMWMLLGGGQPHRAADLVENAGHEYG